MGQQHKFRQCWQYGGMVPMGAMENFLPGASQLH